MSVWKDLKAAFGGTGSGARIYGILTVLIAIIIFFQIVTGGLTLSPNNLIALVQQQSYVLILALGMLMVIIGTHIDLAVGSVAATVGIVVALLMRNVEVPWPIAVVIGLALGALIGAWQGFWVAYVGVPAFVVTLAGQLIFRGANQVIGHSNTVAVPADFRIIGAGYLPEIGPDTGYNNLTLLLGILLSAYIVYREVRSWRVRVVRQGSTQPLWTALLRALVWTVVIMAAAFVFASGRVGTSFPISGLIMVALVVFYHFLTQRTVFGRHIYAVGGNRRAAELSGVRSKRVNFLIMVNMSVLAALAGIIYISRASASGPQDGSGWELDAIAAVFIGGAAVAGGTGTVVATVIGGTVIAVLNNGLQLLGVGSDLVQIIKGLVLLVAVAFDVYSKSQGRPSITGLILKGLRFGSSGEPELEPAAKKPSHREAVKG